LQQQNIALKQKFQERGIIKGEDRGQCCAAHTLLNHLRLIQLDYKRSIKNDGRVIL
jgi:hypothetical protein